jgi:hypothetical protein
MKKLIVISIAIAITAGAYAQLDSTTNKTNLGDKSKQSQKVQNNSGDKSYTDGVVLLNGKVMQVKNGQTVVLDQNLTLDNGTEIMTDGTYIKKDGSKMKLKEGQNLDMSGKIVPAKTNKDNKIYLVPDSTKKKINH